MTLETRRAPARLALRDIVIALGLVLLATLFLITHVTRHAIPMEDAFMLLRYSRNLAEGHGIVWNVGEHPVEGATDFLYMVLIGWGSRLTHLDVIAVGRILIFASQLITVAALYLAARWIFDSPVWIAAFFAVLCACGSAYHFVDSLFSAPFFGLFGLLAWVAVYLMAYRGITWTRAIAFSLLGLTLGLIRPEGNLIALFMLLATLYGAREGRLRAVLAFAVVFGLLGGSYFLWRWHYFGYPLPNPFYVKHETSFATVKITARVVIELTFPVLPMVCLGLVNPRGRRSMAMLALVVLPFLLMWGLMSLDNNGFDRFQYIVVSIIYLAAADTLTAFYRMLKPTLQREPGLRRGMIGFAVATAVLSVSYLMHLDRATYMNKGGHDLGLRLQPFASHGDTMVTTEAGALPFYSEWRAIDAFGLNDEYIAHHGGDIPFSYLDRYKPEILLYKAQQFGPVRMTAAEAHEAQRHYGGRQPLIANTLRSYAQSHGYTLAAVYGAFSCDYHYIWVKTDSPDAPALLTAIRDYPYNWQYGAEPTFDFRASDGAAVDNCRR